MKQLFLAFLLLTVGVFRGEAQLSRELSAFRELDVTDKIQVRLHKGTADKIVIEGELANQMELTQRGDVLRLKMTTSSIMQGDKVEVHLYTTNLSRIIARKGAEVTTDRYELQADSIYLSANEGARIDVDVRANELKVFSTAGAMVAVAGQAKAQTVNCTFGGQYDAVDLISDSAYVRTNGGGRSQVHVRKSIDAQTRAGGVIDVYGKPAERKERRLAGGKINFL